MKTAFAILIIFALCFSAYSDPPIAQVMINNENVNLFDVLPSGISGFENCAVENDPSGLSQKEAITTLTIKALTAFPTIDDRVSYADPPYVFWMYGERHKTTVTWETGLSGTTCTSSADFISFEPEATIKFSIGSKDASITTDENKIAVPNDIRTILRYASGENLTISFTGTARFVYDLDVYSVVCTQSSGCSCEKNTEASGKKELKFKCENSLSYEIENQDDVYLLQKPILKEQWYKNNHFDSIFLTNRRIYKAEVWLNNISFGNVTFYEFNISNDEYGLQYIHTSSAYSENNASGAENSVKIMPIPLQKENNTFRYLYEINSTYETIGLHSLGLKTYDDFGQKTEKEYSIYSKQLSFSGNTSETNEAFKEGDPSVRASSAWNPISYNTIFITLGVAGLFIIFSVFRAKIWS